MPTISPEKIAEARRRLYNLSFTPTPSQSYPVRDEMSVRQIQQQVPTEQKQQEQHQELTQLQQLQQLQPPRAMDDTNALPGMMPPGVSPTIPPKMQAIEKTVSHPSPILISPSNQLPLPIVKPQLPKIEDLLAARQQTPKLQELTQTQPEKPQSQNPQLEKPQPEIQAIEPPLAEEIKPLTPILPPDTTFTESIVIPPSLSKFGEVHHHPALESKLEEAIIKKKEYRKKQFEKELTDGAKSTLMIVEQELEAEHKRIITALRLAYRSEAFRQFKQGKATHEDFELELLKCLREEKEAYFSRLEHTI